MSVEQEGNNFIKAALLKSGRIAFDIFKFAAKKTVTNIHEKTRSPRYRSMKKFMRNNKNQGIHTERGLTKKEAKEIMKSLNKFKADYFVEKQKDGTYNISVTSANKSTIYELKNKDFTLQNHVEKLNEKEKDILIKELNEQKIDYSIKQQEDGKYEITVSPENKEAVQQIKENHNIDNKKEDNKKEKSQQKEPLAQKLKKSKEKAAKANAERMAPVKHRDIGAR